MPVRLRPPHLKEGQLATDPFAHLLLCAFEARFAGSLVVWSGDDPFAEFSHPVRVRLEAGVAVAADMGNQGPGLLQALIPMTVRPAGTYRFLADLDAVGAASHVVRGHVDPYTLLASALRGPAREDAIEEVLRDCEGRDLHIQPTASLTRFGLTRQEWLLVQELRRRPQGMASLAATGAPAGLIKRTVYLLRVTGAASPLPARSAQASGPVSVPARPQMSPSIQASQASQASQATTRQRPTAPPDDAGVQAALVARTASRQARRPTPPAVPKPQSAPKPRSAPKPQATTKSNAQPERSQARRGLPSLSRLQDDESAADEASGRRVS